MAESAPGAGRGSETSTRYLAKDEGMRGFPPGKSALLVIDPVNDFLSEGGAAWDLSKATVMKNDVIGNLKRVIAGAREHGIPVLFGPMAFTEEDYAEHALHRRSGINRVMFERRMFLAGSWGADFHPDLQPVEDDVVLLPHKSIDVFETDLPEHLERLGVTHLVICGMTANLCCESTGRHAMERGFDVTFLSDATGATGMPAYEAAIRVNYPLVANAVITVDEFLEGVDAANRAGPVAKPGDKVLGSDHGEIGKVERVVDADDAQEAHLVVKRGIVREKPAFIPLDAVTKQARDEVIVNVPDLVAGSMPWSEPPRRESVRGKLGPPADGVENLYGSRAPTRGGTGNY